MAKPRVLLTGGTGFIGQNILESSLNARFEFVAPRHRDLDLLNASGVDAFFARNRFDAIVHSAVKPGHRNALDLTDLFYSNTRMFFNLERHAGSVDRMLVIGSGGIYDSAHYRSRMGEEYAGTHVPADEHGFSKYVCGRAIENSRNIYDLRGFGIFGKYEDYTIRFISNMMCKCLFDLPLTMNQDRRFDFLYIDDLMPVLGHFLTAQPPHHAYNVTSDETVSLLALARQILALSGKDLPIVVKTPGMGSEYSGDNSRLKKEFPAFRPTPLGESLPSLYRWYTERRHLIRVEELLHDK